MNVTAPYVPKMVTWLSTLMPPRVVAAQPSAQSTGTTPTRSPQKNGVLLDAVDDHAAMPTSGKPRCNQNHA